MNYEIVTENENKYAIENSKRRLIRKDEEGREYFFVKNRHTSHSLGLFTDRIKDAIQTIKDGEGDVVRMRGIFGPSESVLRFIDREYGESLRQKTLEGYKNTTFGYSLKFGYPNSFGGSYHVLKNNQLGTIAEEYVYFDTEEEANACREKMIAEAEKIAEKYHEIEKTGETEALELFVKNNHQNEILFRIWGAIAEKDKWNLTVVQAINKTF